MKNECAACGETDMAGSIKFDDGSCLCADCRKAIFSLPTDYACGNCEGHFDDVGKSPDGMKCPICGYVDGKEIFPVHTVIL